MSFVFKCIGVSCRSVVSVCGFTHTIKLKTLSFLFMIFSSPSFKLLSATSVLLQIGVAALMVSCLHSCNSLVMSPVRAKFHGSRTHQIGVHKRGYKCVFSHAVINAVIILSSPPINISNLLLHPPKKIVHISSNYISYSLFGLAYSSTAEVKLLVHNRTCILLYNIFRCHKAEL